MKKKEIEESLHRRFEKINELYGRIISSFATEDIHRYRVEIKKLKAFLHLCATGNGEHGKSGHLKLPRTIKQFYRLIGEIRNLELQLQRVNDFFPDEHCRPSDYLKQLEQRIEQLRSEVAQLASPSLLLTGDEKVIKRAICQKFNKRTVKVYMQDILKSIRRLKRERSDEQLHAMRKVFKDLGFNKKLIVPAREKMTPAKEKMTPAKEVMTPAREVMTPAKEVITPAKRMGAPAKGMVSPVKSLNLPGKEIMALLSDNQDLSTALHYLQGKHWRELPEAEYEQLTGMALSLAAQKIRTKENLEEKLRLL